MAGKRYRTQNSAYMVSGSSALAHPRYPEQEFRAPTYEQRVPPRPPARRRQDQGVRTLTMLVALCAVFAVLAGVSLSKRAACSTLQKQITAAQSEIKKAREANQALESMLVASTDGEQIRNYAVITLGMKKLEASDIHAVRIPDTRPLGDALPKDVQMKQQEEGGFFAMLADLLRQIPI